MATLVIRANLERFSCSSCGGWWGRVVLYSHTLAGKEALRPPGGRGHSTLLMLCTSLKSGTLLPPCAILDFAFQWAPSLVQQ